MSQRRRATHAGSWYSNRESELHQRMDGWLAAAKAEHRPAKAIISPHAGYEYCGSCAAYAYKQIDPSSVDRVFILGPSHHYPLGGCALTICDSYETPFYDLRIDQKTCTELFETGMFERMSIDVDEDEHSIEMQLPYLAKVMESRRNDPAFRIIPILVGSLSVAKEAEYGRLLSKYLDAPRTLVIASSDFCHWGSRFSYTHYKRECGEIFESITQLDRDGIDAIESLEPTRFAAYLRRNTQHHLWPSSYWSIAQRYCGFATDACIGNDERTHDEWITEWPCWDEQRCSPRRWTSQVFTLFTIQPVHVDARQQCQLRRRQLRDLNHAHFLRQLFY